VLPAMVVADAMNCQRETAAAIVGREADYLLSVKGNQAKLKENIADYVQDELLRRDMETASVREKNRERVELRRAFVTQDIGWLDGVEEWANLCCIGAINTVFESKNRTTNEWHYYISSRALTADELLAHARAEWRAESMHWLLDVHFGEDHCRIQDENAQKVLNMIRKIVLNSLRLYKDKTKSKVRGSEQQHLPLREEELIEEDWTSGGFKHFVFSGHAPELAGVENGKSELA